MKAIAGSAAAVAARERMPRVSGTNSSARSVTTPARTAFAQNGLANPYRSASHPPGNAPAPTLNRNTPW